MPTDHFEAFKTEIESVVGAISALTGKTVRDSEIRERIRLIYRTWITTVRRELTPLPGSTGTLYKMGAELERLAQLTSKIKSRGEYLSRMRRVIGFTHNMALALPLTREEHAVQTAGTGQGLFIPEIPDLPYSLVPNSIVGWRDRIQAFVREHPFDKSVFIMIRYRKNNNRLIDALKEELSKHGCNGIVASDHNLTKDLYNPVACLLACSKGIAVFDAPGKGPQFNPNVAYELGMLHLLGRECLILKHSTLKSLHADILMKLYTGYRTAKDARCHVAEWLQEGHDRPVE